MVWSWFEFRGVTTSPSFIYLYLNLGLIDLLSLTDQCCLKKGEPT